MKFKRVLIVALIALVLLSAAACVTDDEKGKIEPEQKTQLTADMITVGGTYSYTGDPICPDQSGTISVVADGSRVDASQFTYSYSDNVNAGTASVTVTAKESCTKVTGSATAHFEIAPATKTSTDISALQSLLDDPNYGMIYYGGDDPLAANSALVVPKGKTLQLNNGLTVNGKLTVDGTLIVYNNGKLFGSGSLTNNGTLELRRGARLFAPSGTISGDGDVVNEGTVYVNSATNIDGSVVVRRDLSDAEISLEYPELKYDKDKDIAEYTPGRITISHPDISGTADGSGYSPVYSDNDGVGTATVTLRAPIDDEHFFGTASATYRIVPGDVTVTSVEDALDALADANYGAVRLIGQQRYAADITVPQGKTLTIASSLDCTGKLTNLGTLQVEGTLMTDDFDADQNAHIINTGTIFCNCDFVFDPTRTDNAKGTIYSYCAQSPDLPGAIEKHDIADPLTGFVFNRATLYYNGAAHDIFPVTAFGAIGIRDISVGYYRDGKSTKDLASVGKIEARYSVVKNSRNAYRGSASLLFEIVSGTASVSNRTALSSALSDPGYYLVTMTDDITDIGTVRVPEGKTLDTGGNKLECIDLINYGTVLNPYDGDLSDPSAVGALIKADKVTNCGKIVNEGIVALSPLQGASWQQQSGSEFVNDGVVFINENTKAALLDDVRVRIFIDSVDIELEYASIDYDGGEKCPTVTATKGDASISADDMTVIYADNVSAGQAMVTVSGKGGLFAALVGSKTLTFGIERGATIVSDKASLLAALDDENWQTITLGANIKVGSDAIELHENTTVACDEYMLVTNVDNIPSVPQTSAITATATSVEGLSALLRSATYITLGNDLTGNIINVKGTKTPLAVTLDLDGKRLDAALCLDGDGNTIDLTVTNSSETQSYLAGNETATAAVVISGDSNRDVTHLTLESIAVNGIVVDAQNASVDLTVTRCIITQGANGRAVDLSRPQSSVQSPFAATFTDCTISGEEGVYVNAPSATFTRCTITAEGEYSAPSSYSNAGKGFAAAIYFQKGVPTSVVFEECKLESTNGYALVQAQSAAYSTTFPAASYAILLDGCTLPGGDDKTTLCVSKDNLTIK